jgi:superfamily I DNA/RNA helicase
MPDYKAAFVRGEWDNVIRAQGISTWEGYRDADRAGRSRELSATERKALWKVFGGLMEALAGKRLLDWPGIPLRARELLEKGTVQSPYTAVVVDEIQDLRPPELRFIRALCARNLGNLMLCGDAGQRIYPGGFSLGALGIDVRGRSFVLRINYRTTEQIRRVADQVLGPVTDDLDGGEERREGTRSLLRGPVPLLRGYASRPQELQAAVRQIRAWLEGGMQPAAIGVFARTKARVETVGKALGEAKIPWRRLSDRTHTNAAAVEVDTMHRAKGLEFKAVLVLDCTDAVVPDPAACHATDDPQDRDAALARERHLLYVAMTRARDELVVSFSGKPSRFIESLLVTHGGQ